MNKIKPWTSHTFCRKAIDFRITVDLAPQKQKKEREEKVSITPSCMRILELSGQ